MTQRIGTKITNRILAYLNKDNKRKHSEKLDCTQYMKQQDGMHCGIHVCWNAYQLGYWKEPKFGIKIRERTPRMQ